MPRRLDATSRRPLGRSPARPAGFLRLAGPADPGLGLGPARAPNLGAPGRESPDPLRPPAVRDLLEPGETLADAATWADEIRRERRHTSPWHYVNVPISEPHYNARFCDPRTGCVVAKAEQMRRVLADSSLPKSERREALRFFVHFVQDLHQPLHVGENHDKGGNDLQVRFFNRGSNLHRVWDSSMIEKVSDNPTVWVDRLQALATPENVKKWSGGTPDRLGRGKLPGGPDPRLPRPLHAENHSPPARPWARPTRRRTSRSPRPVWPSPACGSPRL